MWLVDRVPLGMDRNLWALAPQAAPVRQKRVTSQKNRAKRNNAGQGPALLVRTAVNYVVARGFTVITVAGTTVPGVPV